MMFACQFADSQTFDKTFAKKQTGKGDILNPIKYPCKKQMARGDILNPIKCPSPFF
jgi:hypothetical protein